ncbi:segregation protein B [Xenorhabdus ishibashii]|uniref:Segregation protein B n=1 Tax=Xenorhabdus ishibashii TaxID=1034471 RepID=A0A2D0KAE9_9GAMM|nr:segregation protein B [Xenorhabdus ishibashii]
MTTAEKRGLLQPEHQGIAKETMCQLNKAGTQRHLLCDPQTSGGFLLAILPDAVEEAKAVARSHDIDFFAIGELTEPSSDRALIEVLE